MRSVWQLTERLLESVRKERQKLLIHREKLLRREVLLRMVIVEEELLKHPPEAR